MAGELQRELASWLAATFREMGAQISPTVMLTKLVAEVGELNRAYGEWEGGDIMPVLDEAADVAICLYNLAAVLGFDLDAAIRAKHAVNVSRQWKRNDDGTIGHVKSGPCAECDLPVDHAIHTTANAMRHKYRRAPWISKDGA